MRSVSSSPRSPDTWSWRSMSERKIFKSDWVEVSYNICNPSARNTKSSTCAHAKRTAPSVEFIAYPSASQQNTSVPEISIARLDLTLQEIHTSFQVMFPSLGSRGLRGSIERFRLRNSFPSSTLWLLFYLLEPVYLSWCRILANRLHLSVRKPV